MDVRSLPIVSVLNNRSKKEANTLDNWFFHTEITWIEHFAKNIVWLFWKWWYDERCFLLCSGRHVKGFSIRKQETMGGKSQHTWGQAWCVVSNLFISCFILLTLVLCLSGLYLCPLKFPLGDYLSYPDVFCLYILPYLSLISVSLVKMRSCIRLLRSWKLNILKRKIEEQDLIWERNMAANNLGSAWSGIKTITGLQNNRHSSYLSLEGLKSDAEFADALNCFYTHFDTLDFSCDVQELKFNLNWKTYQHFDITQKDV